MISTVPSVPMITSPNSVRAPPNRLRCRFVLMAWYIIFWPFGYFRMSCMLSKTSRPSLVKSRPPTPLTNSGREPNIQSATSTWCEASSAAAPPEYCRNSRQFSSFWRTGSGFMTQPGLRFHCALTCVTLPSSPLSTICFTVW